MTETAALPTAALPLWVEDAFTGPARPRPDHEPAPFHDGEPDRTADAAPEDATVPGRDRAERTVVVTRRELALWRSLRRLVSPLTVGGVAAVTAVAWLVGTFAGLPVASQLAVPLGASLYAAFVGNVAGRLFVGATRMVNR